VRDMVVEDEMLVGDGHWRWCPATGSRYLEKNTQVTKWWALNLIRTGLGELGLCVASIHVELFVS